MNPSERRFALRTLTRDAHETLDAVVGSFSTREAYRRYLQGIATFRITMEAVLDRVAFPVDWQWRPLVLGEALSADAADLGLPPINARPVALDLSDRSALLGALYVLEGASLGARVLKVRAADLGLTETFGARHLVAMSNDIAQWRGFLVLLDAAEPFDNDRAAHSANAVFALALGCFESELVALH